MSFAGFKPEGLDLLIENRLRNDKAFYEEHKAQLRETVIQPFHELIAEISPTMLAIDPLFVTVPSRMVSRIRRDNRYTKDKTLYRANMWMFYRRARAAHEMVPFYYLEFTPEYWGYGSFGCFEPGEMALAREMILNEDKLFYDAYHATQKEQIRLEGAAYKRPHFPDAKAEYQPWLDRKELGVVREFTDYAPLFDGSFVPEMLRTFEAIAPFYRFLSTVHERTGENRR